MTDRAAFEGYATDHTQFGSTSGLTPLLAEAVRRAGPSPRVVDIGCGEGGTLEALAVNRGLIVGVELSHLRARIAHSRGHSVVVADGLHVPFRSGSVTLAVSRHVIEHVPDDRASLQEVRRILAPAGALYLETPLRLAGAWYFYRNPHGRRALDPTHLREYRGRDEVSTIIEEAGLRIARARIGRIVFPVGELIARLWLRLRPRSRPSRRLLRWRLGIPVPRYREIHVLAEPSPPGVGGPTSPDPEWRTCPHPGEVSSPPREA